MDLFWDILFQIFFVVIFCSLIWGIFEYSNPFFMIIGILLIICVIIGFIYSVMNSYFDINIFDEIKNWFNYIEIIGNGLWM